MKKYLPSSITFFSFVSPPAGVTLSWLILGEDVGIGLLIGLVFIVVGIIVFGGDSYIKIRKIESSR
jgi:drug/metabolite transporter (DMT)-like permease